MTRASWNFGDSGFLFGIPDKDAVWISTEEFSSNNAIFYYNDFFLTRKHPFFKKKVKIYSYQKLLTNLDVTTHPKLFWEPFSAKKYVCQYHLLKKEFKKKSLLKGVPYLEHHARTKTTAKDFFLYALKQTLVKKHSDGNYLFAHWDFSKNFFCLGVSPELLFHLQGKTLDASALAGTAVKINFSEQEARRNQKLRSEHQYVVEDLEKRLARFGTVAVGSCQLLELRHFYHFKTPLVVQCSTLETPSFEHCLEATFPSPALGAFPRDEGRAWLKRSSPRTRFFAGPFGFVSPDGEIYAIGMIRAFTYMRGTVTVTAGGGVVSDSVYSREREEILWKLTAIKKEFGLSS